MIQIVKNELQTGVKRFVCDEKSELSKINLRTLRMGSTCYVINSQEIYILNGKGEWVLMKTGSGSGGGSGDGGSSDDPSGGGSSDEPGDDDIII